MFFFLTLGTIEKHNFQKTKLNVSYWSKCRTKNRIQVKKVFLYHKVALLRDPDSCTGSMGFMEKITLHDKNEKIRYVMFVSRRTSRVYPPLEGVNLPLTQK